VAPRAFVVGCAGLELTEAEIAFLREADPWGLILFARNCARPDQVRALTGEFRDIVGRSDAPVLIDQEGGRVQRLRPPLWPSLPPAAVYGALDRQDLQIALATAALAGQVTGAVLAELGITVDCAPVCDLSFPETHAVIGDRAFSADPARVAPLAGAFAEGLLEAGILPIVKHVPGHGRAKVDSHQQLPVVEASLEDLDGSDFEPFRGLAHMPAAMTAHVVYTAVDPEAPATLSPAVVETVIRGRIGFDGLLFTDDLSMGALSGPVGERARCAWGAGVDIVLHCSGDMEEMTAVAAEAPLLAGKALARAEAALGAGVARTPRTA